MNSFRLANKKAFLIEYLDAYAKKCAIFSKRIDANAVRRPKKNDTKKVVEIGKAKITCNSSLSKIFRNLIFQD